MHNSWFIITFTSCFISLLIKRMFIWLAAPLKTSLCSMWVGGAFYSQSYEHRQTNDSGPDSMKARVIWDYGFVNKILLITPRVFKCCAKWTLEWTLLTSPGPPLKISARLKTCFLETGYLWRHASEYQIALPLFDKLLACLQIFWLL